MTFEEGEYRQEPRGLNAGINEWPLAKGQKKEQDRRFRSASGERDENACCAAASASRGGTKGAISKNREREGGLPGNQCCVSSSAESNSF